MIFKILEAISLGDFFFWIAFSVLCVARWRENCQPYFQLDPKFVPVMLLKNFNWGSLGGIIWI